MRKKQTLLAILLAIFAINVGHAQTPISEVQGEQDASPLIDQMVTIKGIVTASSTIAPGYFVQDGTEAWTGIYVYDPNRTATPEIGDEVQLTGKVSEYFEMTEMVSISSVEILSSGNQVPAPIVIEGDTNLEPYEGVLVKINATCSKASLGYGEWQLNDSKGNIVVNDLFFAYTPTEGTMYTVTGPIEYSYNAYKIEPRSADDIITNAPIYFTVDPYQSNLSKNSITVNWETNDQANSVLLYGKTNSLELGEIKSDELGTTHQISLTNLEAGELYYTKAFSVLGEDTTTTMIRSYTTISNSSGQINVAFNQVEYKMLTKPNGESSHSIYTESMADTIAFYINKATETLDIAIYDVINHAPQSTKVNQIIFDAIKAKAAAGVKVRLITDDTSTDAFFTELMNNANVMWGNTEAIMHHKFVVVDREKEQDCWVLTGSTNWTYNNLIMDANNIVTIQDRSLAKAYTAEFNEMWGGSQETPDYVNSRYGGQKMNDTPQLFEIAGDKVELYFSPSDKTESKIVEAINNAEHEISFAIMVFTSDPIRVALINAHNRGVKIKGVIDYVEYSGSEYEPLLSAGIDVVDYANIDATEWPDGTTIHHKFVVCDFNHPDSDPTLVNGTHNWSASAESRNDENTLVLHNASLCTLFANEVNNIYEVTTTAGNSVNRFVFGLKLYPNPIQDILRVQSKTEISSASILNLEGQIIQSDSFEQTTSKTINCSNLTPGIYLLKIENGSGLYEINRFIKE